MFRNLAMDHQSIRKNNILMATWNICTILQPRKMQEVAQEMTGYKIDIITLQEMRWQGSGRIDKPEFTIYTVDQRKEPGSLKQGL
jgi:exonuclease III